MGFLNSATINLNLRAHALQEGDIANCFALTCILAQPSCWTAANQNSAHCCQSKMAAPGQQTAADAAAF